ncbi:MAG: hypothetical protein V4550_12550 [Gemmatimonadota bacterium]
MRTHSRSGLTVVEVLVALILVCVGLLGMAGSSALALRTTLDAARRREATQRSAIRIASLAASGCAAARGGALSDPQHALTEKWSVGPSKGGFATVTDTIVWMSARGQKTVAISTAIPC